MKCVVKNQVRDVETNRVLKYVVDLGYGTFMMDKERLLQLARTQSISNCYIFNNKLLVFTKPIDVMAEEFISYSYSNSLKEKLKLMYQDWSSRKERETALDIEKDVDYIFDFRDGLYKVTDIMVHNKLDDFIIPSFVTSLDDGTKYMKTKMNHFDGIRNSKNIESSNILIDKYTDGLFVEIFNTDRPKVELYGLTTILSNSEIYENNNTTDDITLSTLILSGRLRWIKEKVFQNLKANLNITLGKHVRVCNLPSNLTNLTTYDTTLLLNYNKNVKPTFLINKLENKDVLLEFKTYISDVLYGYNELSYNVSDSEIYLKFVTKECLDNFISNLNLKYSFVGNECGENGRKGRESNLNTLEIVLKLSDMNDRFANTDELYWHLQKIKRDKIDDLLFQYSFATII